MVKGGVTSGLLAVAFRFRQLVHVATGFATCSTAL